MERNVIEYLKSLVMNEMITDSIELAERAIDHFQIYDDSTIIMINIKAVEVLRTTR